MSFLSFTELRQQLDSKALSATELAQDALKAAQANPHNAFVDVRPDASLAQAQAADALLAQGQGGPLTGIPIAHKDIVVTQHWASTACSRMLTGYQSPFDAEVVARLKAAGMVHIGKVNCDEFAMGSTNENSAFGPCRNPWDAQAVPGGSSGGSAAAIASGAVPCATGTDTGGSIRQPAALCGITGIKPTYGSCSRYGLIAYASSLDQAGPMARNARDCALLLDAMVGQDPKDSTSVQHPKPQFSTALGQPLRTGSAKQPLAGLRIGLPAEYFAQGLSTAVATPIQAALKQLEALGASLVDVALPRTALSIPAYYVIATAEASSNLSRFDGVRYGHRAAQHTDLKTLYENSRSEGFGIEVQRRIMVGSYVLSHGYYDAYYLQAQKVRRLIAQDFQTALAQCDVLAGPVAPTVAWNLGSMGEDPVQMYLADIYTLGPNLAGLPAMSMPVGFASTAHGSALPVGLQLIGNYFEEATLLALADHYQAHTDWHLQRPPAGGHTNQHTGQTSRAAHTPGA